MSPDKMGQVYAGICIPIVALFVGIATLYLGFKRRGPGVLLGVIVFALLVAMTVAVVIPAISQVESQRLAAERFDKANFEINSILHRFPDVIGAEKVVEGYQPLFNDVRKDCAHVRAYVLYGISQDAPATLDTLAKDLEATGWKSEGTSQENHHTFVQGDNAQLTAEYGDDYAELWRQVDKYDKYLSAIEKYSNTLNVRIDYVLPSWKECGEP